MRTALIAVLLVLLAACGGENADAIDAPRPTQSTPSGLTVRSGVGGIDALAIQNGTAPDCERMGNANEIEVGDQILLKDAEGEVVSTARIGAPRRLDDTAACIWDAIFERVPGGGRSYTAEIVGLRSETVREADVTSGQLLVQVRCFPSSDAPTAHCR